MDCGNGILYTCIVLLIPPTLFGYGEVFRTRLVMIQLSYCRVFLLVLPSQFYLFFGEGSPFQPRATVLHCGRLCCLASEACMSLYLKEWAL